MERPLDDETWRRFEQLQARRPGGFAIAALVRPPDPAAGEDEERWLARVRPVAARAPFGLHTHWTSPTHARPTGGDPAVRVRREVAWLRERGLEPTLFAGGGWYIDEAVADALAELGLADCTGTSFRPRYLEAEAPRLQAEEPATLALPSGRRLAELPATHSLGALARGAAGRLPRYVHAYFHDTDLLDPRRLAALSVALAVLARRRGRSDLAELARQPLPDGVFPTATG
ncbi:MAG TPA: hypothetical protein VGF23_12960 [Gaiellaceae bacterium]